MKFDIISFKKSAITLGTTQSLSIVAWLSSSFYIVRQQLDYADIIYNSNANRTAIGCSLQVFSIGSSGTTTLLYRPQRGYISFVNTFVTPRNNALGPYVPWETFDQRKILRHLSYVCLSVRPCVRLW